MARTFSLGLVVSLLLIFVVTEATRGQTHQVDGQKIQIRGSTRFHSKLTIESNDSPISSTASPRNTVPRSEITSDLRKHKAHPTRESSVRLQSKQNVLKPAEHDNSADVILRTNARVANSNTDHVQNHSRSQITQISGDEITPKRQAVSRRISSTIASHTENTGKVDFEVSTKSSKHLRLRTGRKMYISPIEKDLQDEVTASKNSSVDNVENIKNLSNENVNSKTNISRRADIKNVNESLRRNDKTARDILLSGSESVRVDIPLTVGSDKSVNLSFITSTTTSSINISSQNSSRHVKEKIENNNITRANVKMPRQSDRSKSRSKFSSNDPNTETRNSRNNSRRAKFLNTEGVETNGRSRNRSNAKNVNSRGRSAHKSRDTIIETRNNSKNRNPLSDSGTNANGQIDAHRNSFNNKSSSDGKRRSNNGRTKIADTKIAEQGIRTQSRGRSRVTNNLDVTTAYIPKATVAEMTTTSLITDIITPFTTAKTPAVVRPISSTEGIFRNNTRGENTRSKQLPKEDFFNHGLGFRGRKGSTKESSLNVEDSKTTTSKSETQLRSNPGWTLRRRPSQANHETPSIISTPISRDQVNEITLPNDSSRSTETPLSSTKTNKRGTKRPKLKDETNTLSSIAVKHVTRGSKTFNRSESFGLPKVIEEESDNYPPAFRARLSQLKKSNTKLAEKKDTVRTTSQATKSAATLFSERSKLKLDFARRLVKPELNVDENDFDVTTTPYSGQSKTTEFSMVSESKNIEKTTKAFKSNAFHITRGSSLNMDMQKEKPRRDRWKILESRKSSKGRDHEVAHNLSAIKKNRITSERIITSSSTERGLMKDVTDFNTIPRGNTISHRSAIFTDATVATTVDTTEIRVPLVYSTIAPKEKVSTLSNIMEPLDKNIIVTTIEPIKISNTYYIQKETITAVPGLRANINVSTEPVKVHTTEFVQELTLPPTVTTSKSAPLSSVTSIKNSEQLYPVYTPDAKSYESSENMKHTESLSNSVKKSFRPRYTKQQPEKVAISMVTTKTVGPTSRYIKKKSGVFTQYDAIPKTPTTEVIVTQTKRRDFRPRTATYRRHSETPTSAVQSTVTKQESTSVTITPKPTKYHANVKSSTLSSRSPPSERLVSVSIDNSNDTVPRTSGITDSSNGNSGNSNIFNPTRSAFLSGNNTLLEQLRSTVAPLLNTLGNKTPIFSRAYSNVDTGNSTLRITPNGSPPRFSARYKGAELFVKKPIAYQPLIPSITTSSTTASTPIENSGSAPPVNIISPGEPRFITFYQALESASIRNENLRADNITQQQKLIGGVMKVVSNATASNGAGNSNNDTASPNASITSTLSPDTIVDTTTVQLDVSLAQRLGTGNSSDDFLGFTSTTVQNPANPDSFEETTLSNTNADETTSVPIPVSNNQSITSAPANTSTPYLSQPSTTTETIVTEISKNMDIISQTLSPMGFSSDNALSAQKAMINMNAESMENASTTNETSFEQTTASQNLPILDDASLTTITPQTMKSVTDVSPITNMLKNIEINTIQMSHVTSPSVTETVISTELSSTEEISNDVIEFQTTETPNITSTSRTRLINFAENILSRLQVNLSTAVTQQPININLSPELSNNIPGSLSMNVKNSAQEAAVREIDPGNIKMTMLPSNSENVDTDSAQVTTSTSSITNYPAEITNASQERTTQKIAGLNTPILQDRLNIQKANIRVTPDSSVMTDHRLPNTIEELENSSRSMVEEEVVTTSMPNSRYFLTENNTQTFNDTLLTELMTIAKTLFSEAMNESRHLPFMPNQVSDIEVTTVMDINESTQIGETINYDKNGQVISKNDTLEPVIGFSEIPTSLETTTEPIDVTTLTDLPRYATEDDSNPSAKVGSDFLLMKFNTLPDTVKNPIDVGETSLSQSDIQTPSLETSILANMNFELTTNMPESQSNKIQSFNNEKQSVSIIDSMQHNQMAIVLNNSIESSDRSSELVIDFTINNPFVINSLITNTEKAFSNANESTTSDMLEETMTKSTININNTNQITESITMQPVSDIQVTHNQSLETDASIITTTISDENTTDTTDNIQSFNTESSTEDSNLSSRNLITFTASTTNQPDDLTTSVPQTQTDLISEIPNLITHFQDTVATTAQGTADSGIIQLEQTTETIFPITVPSTTITPTDSPTSSLPHSSIHGTTIPSSVEPIVSTTTMTDTATMTSTPTTTLEATESSSHADIITTGTESATTIMSTTADINENLISTEMSTDISTRRGTTIIPTEPDDSNMISRIDDGQKMTVTTSMNMPTQTVTSDKVFSSSAPTVNSNTTPYLGRFGSSQMTPAPRFSSSSKAPLRDYLIYGIYPNKTIVRKRPEDNLIDARNVNSPYVIFGIYPDGRLVRKFPNGTIIPDSPRNPVEIVFTLSTTTTTNRPAPRPYYNQVNQGIHNRYQAPVYYNNDRLVDEPTGNTQNLGSNDIGLIGNAINVPLGDGPNFAESFGTPGSIVSTNKMSDLLLKTPNAATTTSNQQISVANNIPLQGPVRPIIQDREKNEASRTRVTSDQHSSVYIGQDKFINYQIDGIRNTNPQVVGLKISSVATSVNEGTSSSSAFIAPFENLLNNQSNGVITAPPGFPWRDPLDQIFGITTNSPVRTASVASNQLDESVETNQPILPRPMNPFVEVFTPLKNGANQINPENRLTAMSMNSTTPKIIIATPVTSSTSGISTTTTATGTTTVATDTTTAATNTTTAAVTTSTPILKPPIMTETTATAATTTISTTTPTANVIDQITSIAYTSPRPITTASGIITNAIPTTATRLERIASLPTATVSADDILNGLQTNTQQHIFGTTFGDLAFLNSLLQNNDVKTTTPKTLTQVEQLLANRILALALGKPGPTRSPKAIQSVNSNLNLNSIKDISSPGPSSQPIIIDLLPYSSTPSSTWKSSIQSSTLKRSTEESTSTQFTTQSTITTRAPVVITAKPPTTNRPKTTTQPSIGFGLNLWRNLFGENFFQTSTAASTTKQKPTIKTVIPRPTQTVAKSIKTTQKPTQITKPTTYVNHITSTAPFKSRTTPRSIDISDIQVSSTKGFVEDSVYSASVSTTSSITTTTQETLLNNPNPRLKDISTSTYSPEDDAKFLAALIRATQRDSKIASAISPDISEDDEAFLRTILNNQASISTTTASLSSTQMNSAALLASLLKQQGIEPPTPATKLREQLQLASLGLSTKSQTNSTADITQSTTITSRSPFISSTQPAISTTKKIVTSKPSEKPRALQTTTWSPSSTYPPPLFNSFSNFGSSGQSTRGDNSGSGIVSATRILSRFLGAAISGAAQQLQSLLRNGTRSILSEVIG